jgi:hypothetical protein
MMYVVLSAELPNLSGEDRAALTTYVAGCRKLATYRAMAHGGGFKMQSTNGKWTVTPDFPDDELAVAAAARFRQLNNQGEPTAFTTASDLVVTGTYVAPKAGLVTVAEVYAAWSGTVAHLSAKTVAVRRGAWANRVAPQWGDVAVVDVRNSGVKAWVAKMVAEDLGVATIENAFGVLRQVLGVAVEDNRIPRNPCDGVKIPKRQHADRGYLTHHQVATLAGAVERMPEVIRFLAYTGLRWGEMAALRVCDFNMLRRRINVSRSVTEFNSQDGGASVGTVPGLAGWRTGCADGGQGSGGPRVCRQPRNSLAGL